MFLFLAAQRSGCTFEFNRQSAASYSSDSLENADVLRDFQYKTPGLYADCLMTEQQPRFFA